MIFITPSPIIPRGALTLVYPILLLDIINQSVAHIKNLGALPVALLSHPLELVNFCLMYHILNLSTYLHLH